MPALANFTLLSAPVVTQPDNEASETEAHNRVGVSVATDTVCSVQSGRRGDRTLTNLDDITYGTPHYKSRKWSRCAR